MKKLLFLFAAVLFLVGCKSPSSPSASNVAQHYAIVKNSLWQTTKKIALDPAARSAQYPTYAEIQAQIDADNALSLTNQEWVYLDNAPDITDAPNGNVFYVRRDNGLPVASRLNLTRQYIVDHYQDFLIDAQVSYGGDLVYIDHIPPAPILAKDTTPYEWYSIYVIEDSPTAGVKLYEDHAGYNTDESWSGQWITTPEGQFYDGIPGGGWETVDAYYSQMLSIYQQSIVRPQDTWPGVTSAHVVTRELYPPLPPVTIE